MHRIVVISVFSLLVCDSARAQDHVRAAHTWVPIYDHTFQSYPTTNTIEVANLTSIPGYSSADSYLYVFKLQGRAWTLAAFDDDGGSGRGSKVVNVNTGSTFRVVVAAFREEAPGYADIKINSVVRDSSVMFGGARVAWWTPVTWVTGQTFSVSADGGAGKQPIADSKVYAFGRGVGALLAVDDDGGMNLQARALTPSSCSSSCEVIMGPYAVYSGGDGLVVRNGVLDDDDGDGLVNDLEAEIGTSPVMVDTDLDGIGDYTELFGIADPNGTAGSSDHSLELHAMGSHPTAMDLFIQMDYNSHRSLHPNEAPWLTETFTDDAAYSGKTIYIHLDPIYQLPASVRYVDFNPCTFLYSAPNPAEYADLPSIKDVYLDPLRDGIFTYGIVGEKNYFASSPGPGGVGCQLREPGDPKGSARFGSILVFWTSDPGARGVVEHELGHTMISEQELRFNHSRPRSVMNYTYAASGFVIGGVTRWSYSNGTYPPLCPSGTCAEAYTGTDCDCNEWSAVP